MGERWLRTRLGTVRVRITAAAVLVVGLALVVGSVALVASLRRSLTHDLEAALDTRADDLAAVLESGTQPEDLLFEEREDSLVQVVDRGGRVVTASPNLPQDSPVVDPGRRSATEANVTVAEDDEVEAEDFLVVFAEVETEGGRFTILVGQTLEFVTESTGFVTGVVWVGVPALAALVALTTWWLVGRALRPVDAIRAEVEQISAADLGRRVSVPPTGDEVARLAATMNTMLDRLDASQTRQRQFASDASHELRSPVASIRQHAEVARRHPETTTTGELADLVLEEDLRLERLVDDLLFLARTDEARADEARTLRFEPVDLDDVALGAARHLRSRTGLSVDATGVRAVRISGDPALLRRLVGNLTDNAARHANGAIAISVEEDDGVAVVRVDDDGSGVPPADRRRVFERFVRLDDARSRGTGGSGLGLAIAAEIAATHRGTLVATDSPLGGARFEARFPISVAS